MQTALTQSEKILNGLIIAFIGSLFLPDMPVVGNILLAALLIYSITRTSWKEKKALFQNRKAVVMMTIFMALQLLSLLLSDDKKNAAGLFILRLPLLLFPCILGTIRIGEPLKNRLLLSYTMLMTFIALICVGYACSQWRHTGDASWLYDDSLSFVTGQQSVYMAQSINLAIFFLVYLLRIAYPVKKMVAWSILLFLLLFQFMLASRIAIITLYIAILIVVLQLTIGRKRYLATALLLGSLMLVAISLPHIFPKTVNRFKELQYTGFQYNSLSKESHYNMALTPDQWNGANIRLAIWSCGLELARTHWLTGIPLGDKQKALRDAYTQKGFVFAASSNRNMHNTYLDVMVNMGILGLLVFLAGFIALPAYTAFRLSDAPGLFIVLSFAAAMFTETWLDRSLGCMLIGLFLSLTAAWSSQKSLPSPNS